MAKKWTNKNVAGVLHYVTGNVNNAAPHKKRVTFVTESAERAEFVI